MALVGKALDLYLAYSFIKRLVLPFNKWKAYKTGVISADGEVLVPADKRTPEQKESFGSFDLMILNMKKLLAKIPGGGSLFATSAAALYLMKEENEVSEEKFISFIQTINIDEIKQLQEEVPVNNVGGGQIAGANGDPIVRKKKRVLTRKTLTPK